MMIGVYLSLLLAGASPSAQALVSEFPAQERALVAATAEFFDAVEGGDASNGHEFFSDAYAAALPLDQWRDMRLSQLVNHGPIEGLTAYRITWYPVDSLLGAVDFVGRDADGEGLVCGYVLWEFPEDVSPRLRLYQANHVDTAELARLSPDEASARLLEANCAYTDIESNFALSKR